MKKIVNILKKVLKNKKKVALIGLAILVFAALGSWYYLVKIRIPNYYPDSYPYSCDELNVEKSNENPLSLNQCAIIEDQGKVIVAWRPETKALVKLYGRKNVTIKALEFEEIQDKAFLKKLLGDNYTDVGCIIFVSYPGGQNVYLEDDKLNVINKLEDKVFSQWLKDATPEDIDKFYSNVH